MASLQEFTSPTEYEPQYHIVANIGERPHNVLPEQVDALVSRSVGELALLCLKPGFYPAHPEDGLPIQKIAEEMLTSSGLDVVCTAEKTIAPLDACELYRGVMPPDEEDDAEWGTTWKKDLLTYLSSGPIFSYLLEGTDSFGKAHLIKSYLRQRYATDPTTQIIKNIGHVPDPPDFDISLQILFKDGLTYNSLQDSEKEQS